MSQGKNDDRDALCRLDDVLVADILSASDAEMLIEAKEDMVDPAALAADMRTLFEKSLAAKKKARLVAARSAVRASREHAGNVVPFDSVAARQRLNTLLAHHPDAARKLTLAARKEGAELSDEDLRGMLEDFEELGIVPPGEET